jgi:hypothetical protein
MVMDIPPGVTKRLDVFIQQDRHLAQPPGGESEALAHAHGPLRAVEIKYGFYSSSDSMHVVRMVIVWIDHNA